MSGVPFLHAAYGMVWTVLTCYVVRIAILRSRLKQELALIAGNE
jgi:CcmD family protein